MDKKIINLIAGCLLLVAAPASGQAQTPPAQLPGSVDPGRLQQRFETPPQPRAAPEPLLPEGERKLSPEEASKIRFTLSAIKLTGNTVFSEADLLDIYQPYLGREVSLADIYKIAEAITARYRNAGYVLAKAAPPAQRVENGVVQIQVVEGVIGKVTLEGRVPENRKLLDAYLQKITGSMPLKNEDLERYVLLINDLPGIAAKAVLIPSFDTPGATDLVVQLSEDRWDAALTLDNRGTEFIGPVQVRLQGGLNNALGHYERISAQFVTTRNTNELRFLDFGYAQPVGSEGTVLGLSGNISWSNPGGSLRPFDVEGQNRSFSASVSHPWIRSRRKNVSFLGSLTYKNTITDLRSSPLTEDRLRVLRLGATADFSDSFRGVNLFGAEIAQGLDILNASGSGGFFRTRQGGREDFTKIAGNAMRIQQFTDLLRAVIGVNGQYSFSQLFASEEFGYGGVPFGHAYDPSHITGDHGLAARAEGQFKLPFTHEILTSTELYTFYDIGSVWHIDDNARGKRDSAASLGAGVRFALQNRLYGYLEVADPLTASVPTRGDEGNSPRFFFSLTAPL